MYSENTSTMLELCSIILDQDMIHIRSITKVNIYLIFVTRFENAATTYYMAVKSNSTPSIQINFYKDLLLKE